MNIPASLIVAFPFVILSFAIYFYKKQNTQHKSGDNIGGAISKPKALWLSYAIGSWFILPIFFLFLTPIHEVIEFILIIHLLSWWIRGPLELVMMYKWHNWSPVYGITHDLLHFVLLVGLVAFQVSRSPSALLEVNDLLSLLFIFSLMMAMLFESLFAYYFLKIRGKEKKTVYFADDGPQWKKVNLLTIMANITLYGHLFFQSFIVYKANF